MHAKLKKVPRMSLIIRRELQVMFRTVSLTFLCDEKVTNVCFICCYHFRNHFVNPNDSGTVN